MRSTLEREFCIQDARADSKLLQEEFEAVALINVIHKDESFAIPKRMNFELENEIQEEEPIIIKTPFTIRLLCIK
jgi:hypothetical protein